MCLGKNVLKLAVKCINLQWCFITEQLFGKTVIGNWMN